MFGCNTVHALCVLDTKGYKHALRIFNTYCFSATAVVTQLGLQVMLHYFVSLVWNCVETQLLIIQGDQKVSVHLMITIKKFTSNVQSVPRQSTDFY
jgi:hypothetical protein